MGREKAKVRGGGGWELGTVLLICTEQFVHAAASQSVTAPSTGLDRCGKSKLPRAQMPYQYAQVSSLAGQSIKQRLSAAVGSSCQAAV